MSPILHAESDDDAPGLSDDLMDAEAMARHIEERRQHLIMRKQQLQMQIAQWTQEVLKTQGALDEIEVVARVVGKEEGGVTDGRPDRLPSP